MEKTYAIEVCCPNGAAKMETATKKVEGVADAAISCGIIALILFYSKYLNNIMETSKKD